jgi:hypothetical protein
MLWTRELGPFGGSNFPKILCICRGQQQEHVRHKFVVIGSLQSDRKPGNRCSRAFNNEVLTLACGVHIAECIIRLRAYKVTCYFRKSGGRVYCAQIVCIQSCDASPDP